MITDKGRIKYTVSGIEYTIDFDRYWQTWQEVQQRIRGMMQAISGIVQYAGFYDQSVISVLRDHLSGDLKMQLQHWYDAVKDGTSFKFWLNKYLVLYLSFERGTNTHDGNTITFVRAGAANYENIHTGELESAATNIPRLVEGKFTDTEGLLRESIMTSHLIAKSEALDDVSWVASNVTVTADQVVAPDGTTTADKCVAGVGGGTLTYDTATAFGTNNVAFSIWAKSLLGTVSFQLSIQNTAGTVLASTTITADSEWQRFKLGYKTVSSVANNIRFKVHLTTEGSTLWLWGAQGELSQYPTHYVKDGGAREAEIVYYAIPTWYSERQFSISFWYKPEFNQVTGTNRRLLAFYATTSSYGYLKLDTSDQLAIGWARKDGGYTFVDAWAIGSTVFVRDTWVHICLTWDTLTADSLKVYLNGTLNHTCTVPEMDIYKPNRLYLGSTATPTEGADGVFDEILLESRVIDAAEVRARYNRQYSFGIGQNYFPTLQLSEGTFEPSPQQGADTWTFKGLFKEVLT
jgi:hypothetical protein